jgi:hypothetical protein
MFRGGSYVDKEDFNDFKNNPGYNKLDISDIDGARPKKLF